MWARSELRARWRAWALLGLLAGATFGLAAAAVAGARQTQDAVPGFVAAARVPSAAILPNDPSFDEEERATVAALPEVTHSYPFLVAFGTTVIRPQGLDQQILPITRGTALRFVGPLVAGRAPLRLDEVVVNEQARDKFHLDIGSTMVIGQTAESLGVIPPELTATADPHQFRQRMRVVGVSKASSSEAEWTPSEKLYAKYQDVMPGFVNLMVDLRRGDDDLARLRTDVERIAGHPVNVESSNDLFGIRKAKSVTDIESDGLLLFAFAALLGGGVLVGQALVRTVTAGAADLPTWRALGADRGIAIRAMVAPSVVTAAVGAVTTVVVAVALSSRFPIATAREYTLGLGTHADWLVLGVAVVAILLTIGAVAALTAWWRVTRRQPAYEDPSTAGRWAAQLGWPPALVVGSRLAVEPGRGRRAVPVRSALVGAIVGVLGVVACFTFRAGIDDARSTPQRAGVVWDFELAAGGSVIPPDTLGAIADERDVAAALDAAWHRAVVVNETSVPMFATRAVKGSLPFVVIDGRRPERADEIAFAPTTMKALQVGVGDRVRVGDSADTVRVVGKVLLPATSHTDYDVSGWMTQQGLERAVGSADDGGEDYLLVRWAPGTDVQAASRRLVKLAGEDLFSARAAVPTAILDLGRLTDLPLVLGVFFGLLACATVAHALVTTARRRRHDFAVLRSIGFTRRQSRVAIAWQATMLTIIGVVIGVPLGIAVGRLTWRWLADDYPILYVPPLAVGAIILVVPVALLIANALAAGPARSVAAIRPAEALRVE
jgi:hypothetical protein